MFLSGNIFLLEVGEAEALKDESVPLKCLVPEAGFCQLEGTCAGVAGSAHHACHLFKTHQGACSGGAISMHGHLGNIGPFHPH